jgi:CubicO group peptidase (beta-lactamase class C family)
MFNMTHSIRGRQGASGILLLLFAAMACSSGETSRPGFPRSELTPVVGAPFPYASAEQVGLDPQRLWRFKERLYARVVARHLVGSEILVLIDGRIVLHQAMGWADIDRQIPLRRNGIFPIGSMTKPFLGVVVLQLVEQGLVQLDAPVATYLPSFDNSRSGGITIRQLLTHRSGFAQGAEPEGYGYAAGLADAVTLLGAAGPDFTPGERFIYSGLNSDALGAVVEAVTGKRVENALEARIIEPLGLEDTHTAFAPGLPWAQRVPSLYRSWSRAKWERHWNPLRPHETNWFSPAGGLYASAFDYAKFLLGHRDGRLVADTTVALALADSYATDRSDSVPRWYGMHWEIYAAPSAPAVLPVFGHRGATGTLGMVIPRSNIIVIYLTNSRENDVIEEVIVSAIEMFGD